MENTQCPYCFGEIRATAKICFHCCERLYHSREEIIIGAILEQVKFVVDSQISKPSVSACGAFCYAKHSHDNVRLQECLDECKLASALSAIAAKLQKELILTFADIVWGGGDIDPLPFENLVRERFSRLPKP